MNGPNTPRYRKRFVLLVASLSFFVEGLSLFSYPAISGAVSKLLSLSNTQSGLITSTFGLTYAIFQIPGGFLGDRFGGSRTLLVSLVVAACSPLMMFVAMDYSSALLSRGIAGAACGIVVPSSVQLTSSWFPRNELDRAMAVYGAGWAASQIFSFLILPSLVSGTQFGLPLIFVVAFSLTVAALAVYPALWSRKMNAEATAESAAPESPKGQKKTSKNAGLGIRGLLTKQLFALTLSNFAALAVGVGVLTWASPFLESAVGMTYADAGRIAALIGVGALLGSMVGGYGTARIGARAMIGLSMLITVAAPVLLGLFSVSLPSASIWLVGVGLGEMLNLPAVFALVPYASARGLEVAGLEFGIFNTMSNAGTFVSPVLFGYLLDSGAGFQWAFAALGALALPGLVGTFLIRTKRKDVR